MYQNILVPLDGSRTAEVILDPVEKLAQQQKARVTFLRVEEPPIMLGYDEVIDVNAYRKMRLKRKKQADSYLIDLKEKFLEKKIKTEFQIVYGPVLESILNTAENINLLLINILTIEYKKSR